MLSHEEYTRWASRLALSEIHAEALQRIRESDPVRKIGDGRSVRGLYPSKKMGRQIGFESRTGELTFCILSEHAPDVLEIYDQPVHMRIRYSTKGGKPGAHDHVPDFLVLRTSGAAFVEVKHSPKLASAVISTPGRYVPDGGRWRCPSGEEEAKSRFGAGYEVFVADELPPELIRNIEFLKDHAYRNEWKTE